MTSHQHTTDASEPRLQASIQAGRETRDVNVRGLLYLPAAIIVSAVVIYLLLWWLFGVYENQAIRQDPMMSPLFDVEQRPPEPRLQATPNRDFAEFRRQQEAWLSSYGWIDRQQKIVRIPVSQAMELLLERGLPEPTGPANPEQQPQEQQRQPQEQHERGERQSEAN
jgi:hypothetical protein